MAEYQWPPAGKRSLIDKRISRVDGPQKVTATVFFPAGKYVVSETIDLKANVQGEGTATGYVKATTPADREPIGWYCLESGKPGTWREIYPK